MQRIIIDQPYRFIPPFESRLWPRLLSWCLPAYLDRACGITDVKCSGVERLRASLEAGHGIVLAPNHSRPCDPMVLGLLGRAARCDFFMIASWHVFMQDRITRFLLRRAGAFSVYREGLDKAALEAAVEILENARRPLILFPEGIVSRTNEHLNPLMEGVSFIARAAVKKRARREPPGKVVVHPVALTYHFHGDVNAAAVPVLEELEARLSWRPQRGMPLTERIQKVGGALLALKEIEYLGAPQAGTLGARLANLIEHLLAPLEKEYRNGAREEYTIARVKRLRQAIVPDLAQGELGDAERDRRWRQLADLYLAQQLDFYPPDYIQAKPSPERILETVERFEEDLTDRARVHRPLSARIEVGEALEADAARTRGADPLLEALEARLREMLERNARPTEGARPVLAAPSVPAGSSVSSGSPGSSLPSVPACPSAPSAPAAGFPENPATPASPATSATPETSPNSKNPSGTLDPQAAKSGAEKGSGT